MTGITIRAQKSARPACYTETPTTLVDADNDGISLIKEYSLKPTTPKGLWVFSLKSRFMPSNL